MRLKHVKGASEIINKGKYYVDNPKEYKGRWQEVFANDNEIHLEIGMGKGDFVIEKALAHPNINFIGIEKYDSVFVRAIQKSDTLELSNLKLIKMDAKDIGEVFEKEIAMIYLNFSDPWPKDRHAKRRLTSPLFLEKYDLIFKSDFRIELKTDNDDFFSYSCDSLREYGYEIIKCSFDLHHDGKFDLDDNVMTEYEKRFVKLGVKIKKLVALKRHFGKD